MRATSSHGEARLLNALRLLSSPLAPRSADEDSDWVRQGALRELDHKARGEERFFSLEYAPAPAAAGEWRGSRVPTHAPALVRCALGSH